MGAEFAQKYVPLETSKLLLTDRCGNISAKCALRAMNGARKRLFSIGVEKKG